MRDAVGLNRAFAELLARYHNTLDLLSGAGMGDVDRLIEESVAYASVIEELVGTSPTVVDVGSGAGLPGVVIAASLPAAKVVLVERRRRRGAFLELAVSRLGLDNASVVKGDVKDVREFCAEVVTAQAVAALADVIRLTRHVQTDPCYLISRRGPNWLEELPAVRKLFAGEQARGEAALGSSNAALARAGSDAEESLKTVDGRGGTPAEPTATFTVPVEKRLDHRGSLVALRLTGGPACRSSGS